MWAQRCWSNRQALGGQQGATRVSARSIRSVYIAFELSNLYLLFIIYLMQPNNTSLASHLLLARSHCASFDVHRLVTHAMGCGASVEAPQARNPGPAPAPGPVGASLGPARHSHRGEGLGGRASPPRPRPVRPDSRAESVQPSAAFPRRTAASHRPAAESSADSAPLGQAAELRDAARDNQVAQLAALLALPNRNEFIDNGDEVRVSRMAVRLACSPLRRMDGLRTTHHHVPHRSPLICCAEWLHGPH